MAGDADNFLNTDVDVALEEPVEPESKKKRRKTRKVKKVQGKQKKPDIMKIVLRVLIGMAVVFVEVAVSYTLVTKFLMSPDETELTEEGADQATQEGNQGDDGVEEGDAASDDPPTYTPRSDYGSIQGIYTIGDLVVNTYLSGGKRFFATSVAIALYDKKIFELVDDREPILRDRLLTLFSGKTSSWLDSNKMQLKAEIVEIVKDVMQCGDDLEIYFTKYVIQ